MNYLAGVDRRYTYWRDRDLPNVRAGLAEAVVAELAEAAGDNTQWYGGGTAALDVTSVQNGTLVRRNAKSVRIEKKGAAELVVLARNNAQPFDTAKLDRVVLVHLLQAASGFDVDLERGVASMEGHAAIDRVWDIPVAELNDIMPTHDPAVDKQWRNVTLPVEDLAPFLAWSRDQLAEKGGDEIDVEEVLAMIDAAIAAPRYRDMSCRQYPVSEAERETIHERITEAVEFLMSTERAAEDPLRFPSVYLGDRASREEVARDAAAALLGADVFEYDDFARACIDVVKSVIGDRTPVSQLTMPMDQYADEFVQERPAFPYEYADPWYGPVFEPVTDKPWTVIDGWMVALTDEQNVDAFDYLVTVPDSIPLFRGSYETGDPDSPAA